MDIRNIRELKNTAAQRLESARDGKKITLIYSGITIAAALLVTVITYCLNLQISLSGGLSNMGSKTILSTLDTVLPIVQNLVLMCLELGFLACMLRISRGQYTSPQTLRAGMPRFWAMLRSMLLQSFVYLAIAIVSFYLASFIFSLTPLANKAVEILMPFISDMTILSSEIVIDDVTALQLLKAMIPMFGIFLVLFIVLVIPVNYGYRMVNYVLLDKPHYGAMMALRESKKMMRHNRFALFKLDLSFWWYYVLSVLALAICYGDLALALLGVALPFSDQVSYFLFYGLFLAAEFAIYYFFLSRVEVTYALAYEAIRPKEDNSGGVVLGNIFNM